MKFKKFKAGDKVFFPKVGWTVLEDTESEPYSLAIASGIETFTKEGKHYEGDAFPYIFDHNPFDPNDPKNIPAHGTEWPFLLRGRRMDIGMEILVQDESGIVQARIMTLQLSRSGISVGARHHDGTSSVVWSPVVLFPDELPQKKTTYLFAIPGYDVLGLFTVDFKRMTKEEGEKYAGAKIVPGTEEES